MEPKLKSYKHLIYLGLGFLITGLLYVAFTHSPYFEIVKTWAMSNALLLGFILFLIKMIGIIWPPIPGGILTLGSIPILGWQTAYLADFAGSIVGSSIAYYIGRKWGYQFLSKIFDQTVIDRIQKIKFRKQHELEVVFFTRIFGGSVIEALCYGAGLMKIPFSKFLLGSILSHLAIVLPFYYLASGVFGGKKIFINIGIFIGALIFINIFKKRYLDESDIK